MTNASSSPASQSSSQNVTVSIVSPQNNDTISSLPFPITVTASSQNPIVRADLYIDGQFLESQTNQPFVFQVSKNLDAGQHIIAAKVVDNQGQTGDTSITINYSPNGPPLTISDPPDGSLIQYPLTITAASPNQYDQVNFYYQKDNLAPQLLGPATNVTHFGTLFQYTYTWNVSPGVGTYQIFAQTNSNISSPKVTINVP